MNKLYASLLGLTLSVGLTSAAQAAPYLCDYQLTSGPNEGTVGVFEPDAEDQTDAVNQAMAWIYATFGPVGFSVSCRPQ